MESMGMVMEAAVSPSSFVNGFSCKAHTDFNFTSDRGNKCSLKTEGEDAKL
jgi:hypothetical protein